MTNHAVHAPRLLLLFVFPVLAALGFSTPDESHVVAVFCAASTLLLLLLLLLPLQITLLQIASQGLAALGFATDESLGEDLLLATGHSPMLLLLLLLFVLTLCLCSLQGLAALGFTPDESLGEDLLLALRPQLPSLTPQELTDLLAALATLQVGCSQPCMI